MPQFAFVARDALGRTERGTRDSASAQSIVEEMRGRGLITLDVSQLAEHGSRNGHGSGAGAVWRRPFGRVFGPRPVDVEVSLQQIACMLRSNLPLLSALKTCAAQSTSPALRRVWRDVGARIQEGGSLSTALAEHRCFSRLVVTMAAVGEETGVIEEVLVRAAATLERRRLLRTNVLTALLYPALVVGMAITVVAYMMLGLIPKLETFLGSLGRSLPPLTQALIHTSTLAKTHVLQGVVILLVAIAAFAAIYAWPPARLYIDRRLLRVPLLGTIIRLAATATFARGMGALLTSGVRLTEALRVVEPLHRNRFIAHRVAASRERVLQGGTLSEPLAECAGFYPMLSSMVAVGESSGTLDEVLEQVATFHEGRLEALMRRLSTIIEPVITLVVGGIVGFIYLAFFMAIYAIAGR